MTEASRCPSCGAVAPTWTDGDAGFEPGTAPTVLGPGVRLGQYELGSRLGEGGMSVVFAATDRVLDRPVAIKVLHPNLVGDAGIRRRFLREGRIASGWAHPNVVPVVDTVSAFGVVALVMELVRGPTLLELQDRWKGSANEGTSCGMPLRELGEIGVGLLAGLEAAHSRSIVHRDLKPGNVLVEQRDGRLIPRIIDFGIARVLEGTTYTLTGAVLGTCRYMSPEQVRGEPVDARSDLYAFGVVLFELATGQPLFADVQPYALMMAHVTKEPVAPSTIRPDLPHELDAIVLQCLAKDPDLRPASAAGLRARLTAALAVAQVASAPRTGRVGNGHELMGVEGGAFLCGPDKREVWVDGFAIDRRPVTNGQFEAFLRTTGYRPEDSHRFLAHWPQRRGPSDDQRDHPVVFVSHADAVAYAGWLGLRLPTEAEWEKAARGTDGRRYPWGAAPPSLERAWFGQRGGTTAVGGRPAGASPYGVEDLVGLVWEWCADEDDPAFHRDGPSANPRRPVRVDSAAAVVRGGAWIFDDPKAVRATTRAAFDPAVRLDTVGFRCAG